MFPVVRDPADDIPLHRQLTEDRERISNDPERLERAMREQPVVPNRDPQAGEEVAHNQNRQLPHADRAIPKQHHCDNEPHHRQNRAEEIAQPTRPTYQHSVVEDITDALDSSLRRHQPVR
jgi:hypothetical protein